MKKVKVHLLIMLLSGLFTVGKSQGSLNNIDTTDQKKIACELETGICAPTEGNAIEEINVQEQDKVKLIYFTDPICSACWAIEPELKRLKLEYGDHVEIVYKMGGLLPGWDGFADNANGISKPADVAQHWDEVGLYSGMSIDGDVWLEDPLSSSYPPSIAFKAMQLQGEEIALAFLRLIREMVFLEKRNIAREAVLLEAVKNCGGDDRRFLLDFHNSSVKQSFLAEIKEGRKMRIRGFPTFVFVGSTGTGFKISGSSGYGNYVLALEKAAGQKLSPKEISFSELDLLKKYRYLASKEIAFILSQDEAATISKLEQLVEKGWVIKEKQKFGFFWRILE